MLKLCASSISKPLFLLFEHSLENECFPNEWKKENIVPIHKKGDKQLIQNYRPISLLPICGKIFEKLMFNSLFKYLENNNLLNLTNLGFALAIHVFTNFYQLHLISTNLSMQILPLKRYFSRYVKSI